VFADLAADSVRCGRPLMPRSARCHADVRTWQSCLCPPWIASTLILGRGASTFLIATELTTQERENETDKSHSEDCLVVVRYRFIDTGQLKQDANSHAAQGEPEQWFDDPHAAQGRTKVCGGADADSKSDSPNVACGNGRIRRRRKLICR
jgi:hypothetical protein